MIAFFVDRKVNCTVCIRCYNTLGLCVYNDGKTHTRTVCRWNCKLDLLIVADGITTTSNTWTLVVVMDIWTCWINITFTLPSQNMQSFAVSWKQTYPSYRFFLSTSKLRYSSVFWHNLHKNCTFVFKQNYDMNNKTCVKTRHFRYKKII